MLKKQRGLTQIELLAVNVYLNIIESTEDKATVSDAIQIINGAKMKNPNAVNFNQDALVGNVENVDDDSYSVSIDSSGDYSINRHAVVLLANTTQAVTSVTEKQLIEYTK
jgi:hypothetical protein